MKTITLSADEALLEQAQLIAQSRHKTLDEEFREWLVDYTAQKARAQAYAENYDAVMKNLSHVNSGGKFSRDEMNER